MKITTLSSVPGTPFNDMLESFFDTYEVSEGIECYQLFFCPHEHDTPVKGTDFDDLNKIDFGSRVVILNIVDTIIDANDNIAIEELTEFCANHPEQNFIIFNPHLNLQKQLSIPNLYLDTTFCTDLFGSLEPCEKKTILNKWLLLNSDTKLHKVMTVSYLLSKDYCSNGAITFDMTSPPLIRYDNYKNATKVPESVRGDFLKGYEKFKAKDFKLLNIDSFDRDALDYVTNYNTVLLPVYEHIGVEIIAGSMFFEKTPALSEKEMQSVYGKTFPIYINGVGMAREIKNFFDLDIFEDIIDHSYDEIEDHFERLAAAIDRNEHLLNGSVNIQELWLDNQKRFEDNCMKMDAMLFDKTYQKTVNDSKIQKALNHFGVSVD